MPRRDVSNDSRFHLVGAMEDMLVDRASTLSPDDFQPTPRRSHGTWVMGVFVCIVPGFFILMAGIGASTTVKTLTGFGIGFALILIGIYCWIREREVAQYNDQIDEHNRTKLQRLTGLERDRLMQRSEVMSTLKELEIALQSHQSAEEVARIQAHALIKASEYQAMGVQRDYEFQAKMTQLQHHLDAQEAKNERDWKGQQADLDRQARIDNVQAKVQAEINLLTARHNLENPSTEEEKRRKEFQFQTKMETLSKIAEINKTDSTTAQMLMDMWERGEL